MLKLNHRSEILLLKVISAMCVLLLLLANNRLCYHLHSYICSALYFLMVKVKLVLGQSLNNRNSPSLVSVEPEKTYERQHLVHYLAWMLLAQN